MEQTDLITILSNATQTNTDEKISLNDSRHPLSPACMAGVLISHPNFSGYCQVKAIAGKLGL
jgi:hypothetical protein